MKSYIFHITLFDIAFFGLLFVGLTFLLLLWFARKADSAGNRFLAMALAVAVLWLAQIMTNNIGLAGYIPVQPSLALGPLIFFYLLKTARPDYKFQRTDLFHFGPLLLQLGIQVFEIRQVLTTGVAIADTPTFHRLNTILQLAAFISILAYLYQCRQLIEKFNREQTFSGGDRYRHQLRWQQNWLTGFGILWLLLGFVATIDYFQHKYALSTEAYYTLYLLLMLMMIGIAAKTLLSSNHGTTTNALPVLKPLLPEQLKQKAAWLKNAVKQERHYEDPELSLGSLAEKLGLHTHELSRIINSVLKKSFNDFINEYRVQAIIRKMNDPDFNHITLLGIAYECGFNSKTTFNRTFKQITGKSPADYKNQFKKERPTYNLGRYPMAATAISPTETGVPKWSPGSSNRRFMFKNYLKIAWRNLMRNKGYAAVNITGLAVGIAVCIAIFIIIQYQSSFDNFHAKKDRIYRVLTEYHTETGDVYRGKDLPFPLPAGLKAAFPQIEQVAPVYASQNDVLLVPDGNGEKIFKEQRGLFYADPAFFKMFDFPLLEGSYASLDDPNNVLLTRDIAEKYFGDWRAAMGKTISLQAGGYMFSHGTEVLKVSGILANVPPNTDFQLKVVASYRSFFDNYIVNSNSWNTTSDFCCYILLPPNTSLDNFNQQLRAYSKKVVSADNKDSHIIQPLNDVHYDTQVGNYSNQTISRELLNVLWLIAAFILLIACVNFINLSTAQAVNRAKEVGVRKVLGGNKAQLQLQFIVETFLIVASAVLLAVAITVIALPYINRLLALSLSLNVIAKPTIMLFLLSITIFVTALAGFYPSTVLSRFNPVNALKSKLNANITQGVSLRRGLVVFQFVIAQVLIIGTLIIVKQMDYFTSRPLGFDKDAIVNVPFRVDSLRISRLDYLRNALLAVNGVQAVTYSSNTPIENGNDTWSALRFDHAQKETAFKAITKFADEAYLRTYKLKLIAGRNLQPSGTTKEFLVNESMLKSLGIKKPDDILNKDISIWNGLITCPVVGVVKDFNDRSFRHDLAPLLITTNVTMYNQAGIKVSTANIANTLQSVKKYGSKRFQTSFMNTSFWTRKLRVFTSRNISLYNFIKSLQP